jgi:hypothetical protein
LAIQLQGLSKGFKSLEERFSAMQSRLSRNEKTSQQALAQAATHAEALLVEVVLFFLGGGRPYGICFLAVFFWYSQLAGKTFGDNDLRSANQS